MEFPDIAHRTPSPDGTHQLVIYDCRETSMGRYDARAVLLDARGEVVVDFMPVFAETQAAGIWSEDSAHLAFAASVGGFSFYLVWQPAPARFAVVRIGNPYPLEMRFEGTHALRLQVRDDQLEASNCRTVFEGGPAEFPVRRFVLPEPLVVELASLQFHERSELSAILGFIESEPEHELVLKPDGFFPYEGPPLTSTAQMVNGRKLLAMHLEAFADFGDTAARAWLSEMRSRMGKRYDRGEVVSGILGRRSR